MDWKEDLRQLQAKKGRYQWDVLRIPLLEYCKEWIEEVSNYKDLSATLEPDVESTEFTPINIAVGIVNLDPHIFVNIYYAKKESSQDLCLIINVKRNDMRTILGVSRDGAGITEEDEIYSGSEIFDKSYILTKLNQKTLFGRSVD